MGRAWFTGYYRQMELMAGKELESEADRFKYLFAGGENIGCEQFLGLLNSKALCRVVPVRMRVPLIVYSVHSFAPTHQDLHTCSHDDDVSQSYTRSSRLDMRPCFSKPKRSMEQCAIAVLSLNPKP